MALTIKWGDVSGIERTANALGRLTGAQKQLVLQRAVNHAGSKALTQVSRTLARQTGLPYGTIKSALKVRKAGGASISKTSATINVSAGASLVYEISTSGGDIAMKYFGARETRGGVSAAPFGRRQVFSGTFIKGGRFPNRVPAKGLHGHVYRRAGKDRRPLDFIDSGVMIPAEMVKGATAKVFMETVTRDLPDRVMHEIGFLVPGFFD